MDEKYEELLKKRKKLISVISFEENLYWQLESKLKKLDNIPDDIISEDDIIKREILRKELLEQEKRVNHFKDLLNKVKNEIKEYKKLIGNKR